MSKRVPASATTRKRLEELMDGRTVSTDARSALVKLATRLLLDESGEAQARGLADPLLVAIDGAPGLIRAVEEVFPRSLRQRCLAHKIRNLQQKVPESSRKTSANAPC